MANFQRARFGWVSNNENDLGSIDTAIGFGLSRTNDNAGGKWDRGAGYECQVNCYYEYLSGGYIYSAPTNPTNSGAIGLLYIY